MCDPSQGFTLTGHLQSPSGPVVIYLSDSTGQGSLNLDGLTMTATTADDPTNLVIHMADRGQIDAGAGFEFTGILDRAEGHPVFRPVRFLRARRTQSGPVHL